MFLNQSIQLKPLEKGVFLIIVLVHFALAMSFHLSPDEAHYALYANHLDWSYYDHPPLVGWVQWLMSQVSETDLVMRLVPMFCWVLSAYLSMVLYQKFQVKYAVQNDVSAENILDQLPKIRSILILWMTSPLLNLLSIALVPDCLLMPLVAALMLLTWEMVNSKNVPTIQQWVGLGILLGFCGLSKYTAIFFAMSAAGVLFKVHGLKLVREKGFWLALGIAFVMITPVLYWNFKHEWISFIYQFGHASGSQTWQLHKSIIYSLVLFFAFGPLLIIGLIFNKQVKNPNSVLKTFTKQSNRTEFSEKLGSASLTDSLFSWIFALPTFLILVILAGRGSALPHWIAPAWVALIPLAALGLDRWRPLKKKWWVGVVSFQVASCMAMAGLLLTAGFGSEVEESAISLAGEKPVSAKPNPFADLIGWDQAAEKAVELADLNHVDTLAVMNWTLASRIAWYARPMAVKVIQSHHDQFDLWFGPMHPGDDVLWVDWSLMTFDPPVRDQQFESCEQLEQMPIKRMGRQIAHFNFLLCRNWQRNNLSR